MSKPTRVRYSGVGCFANQWLLSRVQNVSVDTDLSEEEVRELTNDEVVEYAAQTPSVTVTVDTNEYGSCRNLRCVCNITGESVTDNVNVNTFDGLSTDICLMVEEDNILTRTMHVNDAFATSVSWNFDVGGVATETYTLEADNKSWYIKDSGQVYAFTNMPTTEWPYHAADEMFFVSSGVGTAAQVTWTTGYGGGGTGLYTPFKIYVDGVEEGGIEGITGVLWDCTGYMIGDTECVHATGWAVTADTASGARYRLLMYKNSKDTTIPQSTNAGASAIGGITRGMIDIHLATGYPAGGVFAAEGSSSLLRVQSCSIDADLSREVLEELGHYRAYDRSLTLPVPVNVTFSTLSSDLQEWFTFQGEDWDSYAGGVGGIGSFVKTAALEIKVFDKKDTETSRIRKKTLVVSGLQIVSESFGIDVGGNATQDFTAKSSNFNVSGVGKPFDTSE